VIPRETIAKMHAPHGVGMTAALGRPKSRLADAVFPDCTGRPEGVPAVEARDATWAAVGMHAASPTNVAAGEALGAAAWAAARGGA